MLFALNAPHPSHPRSSRARWCGGCAGCPLCWCWCRYTSCKLLCKNARIEQVSLLVRVAVDLFFSKTLRFAFVFQRIGSKNNDFEFYSHYCYFLILRFLFCFICFCHKICKDFKFIILTIITGKGKLALLWNTLSWKIWFEWLFDIRHLFIMPHDEYFIF